MKREDIKTNIPSITDEQLDWLMGEHGRDITREKSAAATAKTELETANATIQTLQQTAKKFEGVNVETLQAQLAEQQQKYDADIAAVRKGAAVELALAAAHAKNGKAVQALLDMDAVTLDSGKLTGLDEQLTALQASDPYLFGGAQPAVQVDTGAEHGDGGDAVGDGVTAAFAALNPDLKL